MRLVHFERHYPWNLDAERYVVTATYACDYCQLLSAAAEMGSIYNSSPPAADAVDGWFIAHDKTSAWHPRWINKGAEYPDVPGPIADVAREASACHLDKRYRAAIMLARAVIEASAKAYGVRKGELFDKIEKMGDRRLLSPVAVAAAHAIRDSGNAVAHGDFAEFVVLDDETTEDEEVSSDDALERADGRTPDITAQ